MINEFEKQKKKNIIIRKTIMHLAMGIIFVALGVFFMFRHHFTLAFNESYPPDTIDKLFGFVAVMYGGWRIYRGLQKNYFR